MLAVRALSEHALCEFDALVELTPPTEPDPPGAEDPPVAPEAPVALPTVIQRYANQSFMTRTTDVLPDTFIGKRLSKSIVVGRKVSSGPANQFGGLIVSSFGELEFVNTDGGLDFLADDYFIDGHPIVIKMGETEIDGLGRERVSSYNSFVTVYTAIAGSWLIEHDVLRLRIKDPGIILQRQLQQATYGGTGGQQGTSDMKGRTVPVCFGRCRNVTPQQVDPTLLTYQVHDTVVSSIYPVYDSGIEIQGQSGSPGAPVDYATYPALATATIPAGTFATSLAGGYFRLGTSPVGTVTADVDGDATDGSWVATHATIMRRLLLRYSELTEDKIDSASFTILHNQNNHTIGLYLPAGDQSTIEQVMERLALSVGAVAGQDREGLYRVVRLDAPLTESEASHNFNDRTIMQIQRLALPYGVPFRSWTVDGRVNWTVQEGGALATGVGQSRRRFLESAARQTKIDVPGVPEAHSTSASATRASLFDSINHSTEEAIRLAGLYALRRTIYQLTVKEALFDIDIGETIWLTYPRWNLQSGKGFIVVSISDDAELMETEIEVFG